MSSHLDALQLRLSHERGYLTAARSQRERELRMVWIAQIEKEIAREKAHDEPCDLSDDDLLAALRG